MEERIDLPEGYNVEYDVDGNVYLFDEQNNIVASMTLQDTVQTICKIAWNRYNLANGEQAATDRWIGRRV